MKNCNNKLRHNCAGNKTYAPCVYYEGEVSEDSAYFEEDCVTLHETTEELYEFYDDIKAEIDLTNLVGDCITLANPKTILSVFTDIITKVCALEDLITAQAATIADLQQQVTDLETNNCP